MRIGEVCGLSWQDRNFEKGVISLRQQIVYIKGKGYCFYTLKTKSSVLKIVMDKLLMKELNLRKDLQAENETVFGDSYRDDEDKVIQQSRVLKINATKVELICTQKDGRIYARTQNLYTHNTRKLQEDTLAIFEKTLQTNF